MFSLYDALERLESFCHSLKFDKKTNMYSPKDIERIKDAFGYNRADYNGHIDDHSFNKTQEDLVDDIMLHKRNIATAFNNEAEQWSILMNTIFLEKNRLRKVISALSDKRDMSNPPTITLLHEFPEGSVNFKGVAKMKSGKGFCRLKTNYVTAVIRPNEKSKSGFDIFTGFPGAIISKENYRYNKGLRDKSVEEILDSNRYSVSESAIKHYEHTKYYTNGSSAEKLYMSALARPYSLYKEYDANGNCTKERPDEDPQYTIIPLMPNANTDILAVKYIREDGEQYKLLINSRTLSTTLLVKDGTNHRRIGVYANTEDDIQRMETDTSDSRLPNIMRAIKRTKTVDDMKSQKHLIEREIPVIETQNNSRYSDLSK